jgi:hypothetical protein
MNFSLSTFTIEIDGIPTIAFQTKWHAEADEICRGWVNLHREEIAEEQIGRIAIPRVIKVRLASEPEKAMFEDAGDDTEFLGDVKIVRFNDAEGHQDEAGESSVTQNQADDTVAKRDHAKDDGGRNSS